MLIHKDLDTSGRWLKFSIMEQLANIGCDVERAIQWKKRGDLELAQGAFERALELLDLTIRDPKNKGPRLKELLRAREAFIDFFAYDNDYGTTEKFWHDYFYAFSYAAALEREQKFKN